MKITFYGIWPGMQQYIKSKLKGKGISVKMFVDPINEKNLQKDTEILAVFVHSNISPQILEKMPKLKMIATMSTGYNHIDLVATKKKKICCCNVPTYGENTVAEQAMALILGLSRKMFQAEKRVKEGVYDFHGLRGVDLKNKTLGIIGTGHIGMHLVKMAHGFDMKVVGYDAYPNLDLAKQFNFKYIELKDLLKKSDFISLHVPLFPSTYHLINLDNIKLLKKGSYIVNTARGELIEPEAILWALDNGRLAGAGLDVMEDENLLEKKNLILSKKITPEQIKNNLINNILIDHPNTIITPHNAFNTTEALKRIIDVTAENIKCYISGKIQNEVKG